MSAAAAANAVRPADVAEQKRTIHWHLTPICVGAEPDIKDPGRWGSCWNAPLWRGVEALLRAVGRRAAEVTFVSVSLGDVAVMAEVGGKRWPLAFVHDGARADELTAALARLAGGAS